MPKSNCLYEVTIRTVQGRFLLKPSRGLNDLILGVIGRALYLYPEIRVFIIKIASNHFHIILSAPNLRLLSRFMNHINSNIAREAGRLHGWKDKFWSRRYRAIPLLDDEAVIAKTKYILSHGPKEFLTENPASWPGVSCERVLLSGESLQGTWYDRSAFHKAQRKDEKVRLKDFATRYPVPLHRLPCLEGKNEAEVRIFFHEMLSEIEDECREQARQKNRQPMGAEAVMNQDPHAQPRSSKKSPAPLCHASSKQLRKAYKEAYQRFVSAYRQAMDLFRKGAKDVEFPENCFLPSLAYDRGSKLSLHPAPG